MNNGIPISVKITFVVCAVILVLLGIVALYMALYMTIDNKVVTFISAFTQEVPAEEQQEIWFEDFGAGLLALEEFPHYGMWRAGEKRMVVEFYTALLLDSADRCGIENPWDMMNIVGGAGRLFEKKHSDSVMIRARMMNMIVTEMPEELSDCETWLGNMYE